MSGTVDLGLGFERDTDALELALLLNQFPGIKTQRFCQGGENELPHIVFAGAFDDLMTFCNRLRPRLSHETELWEQDRRNEYVVEARGQLVLMFDGGFAIRAKLRFSPAFLGRIVQVLTKLLSCPPEVYPDHLAVNEPVTATAVQVGQIAF